LNYLNDLNGLNYPAQSAILDTPLPLRYGAVNLSSGHLIQSGGGIGPSKPQQPVPKTGTLVLIPASRSGREDKVRVKTSSYLR
jgi:hypothetical protein